ncbi:exonuclease domain-containing protein [Paenibacillus sp. MZ04-78.2]|uniref:exonuclease domain-containing protein n=1 Tax=Paenibacillus sp. MZ04-78.2 TaxID=2962034 RepID=UPI0035CC0A24
MNYIVLDLEATCWENDRTKQNEIIEIGAVKINDKLKIVDEFQTFIKRNYSGTHSTQIGGAKHPGRNRK